MTGYGPEMRDPYLILGVDRDAGDETVHARYLEAIKACPPERDPAGFEALRQAYETIRERRRRIAHDLFDATPPRPRDVLEQGAPSGSPRRPDTALFRALLRGEE